MEVMFISFNLKLSGLVRLKLHKLCKMTQFTSSSEIKGNCAAIHRCYKKPEHL